MPLRICKTCGKEFDSGSFGTGLKYCNSICRDSKGHRYAINRAVGRPRKFPKVATRGQELLIDAYFLARGYHLSPTRWEGVRVLTNSWNVVRVCYGGGHPREDRAHVSVYFEGGDLRIRSTCIKGRRIQEPPEVPRLRVIRSPCKQEKCKKCCAARWLRKAIMLAKPIEQVHTSAMEGVSKDKVVEAAG